MKKQFNNIKWGVILTYVMLAFNIAMSIIYTPAMIRILGQAEHGLYSTVASTMSWLSLLSLGVGASYIKFYTLYEAKGEDRRIAELNGLFLIMYMIIGMVALFCGFYLSNHLTWIFSSGLSDKEYKTAKILARIATIDLAISFPASIFNSIIRAREKFVQVKLVNFFQCAATPLITLPIIFMGYGSIGMIVVATCVDIIAYSCNVFYCLKKLRAKFKFNHFEKGLLKNIGQFSFFIAINSIINQINSSLDKVLLARYVNTISVSVYTIGFSLYSYYSSFSNAVSSMFVPRINRIVSKNIQNADLMKKELTEIFVKLGRIQFYIQMLMCTGIIFFGRQFIKLWAGKGYENSYWVAVLLCIAYTVPLCQSIGVEIQRAQNKHRVRTIVYAIMTSVNVIMTIILCRIYGEVGATVGTVIAVTIIDTIFMNFYYQIKLNIDIKGFWLNIGKISVGLIPPFLLGIIINVYGRTNTIISLLLNIILYALVYCVSMWILAMNNEEKQMVIGNIVNKFKK